jgi:hypothetical protein
MATFESDREIDIEYYKRFSDFLKIFDKDLVSDFQGQSLLLTEAAEKEDRRTIRDTLSGFYASLQKRYEQKADINQEKEKSRLSEKLSRLENSLLAGDTKTANAIIGEIGKLELSDNGRELYIKLYDLMFDDKTEEILKLIKEQNNG